MPVTGDLATLIEQAKTGLAQSTVSAYMAVLERAGLVRSTRVGKWTHYRRDEENQQRCQASMNPGRRVRHPG